MIKIKVSDKNAIRKPKNVYILTEEYIKGIGVIANSIICVSVDKRFCEEQMKRMIKADIYGLFEENGAERLNNNMICSCNEEFEEYVTYQIHEFEFDKPWIDFRDSTQ